MTPTLSFPDFSNDEIIYFGQRVEPYFASAIVAGGLSNSEALRKVFALKTPARWLQVDQYFFNIKSDIDALTTEVRQKLEDDGKAYVQQLVSDCFAQGEQLIHDSQKLATQFNSYSGDKQELVALLEEFRKRAREYCVYYNIAFFDKPEMEIAERIASRYSESDAERAQLFEIITTPSRETAYEREQDDFLRLCQYENESEELERQAEEHAQKYGWLAVRFFVGTPWTKQDILQRWHDADKAQAVDLLESALQHRKDIDKALESFYEQITPQEKSQIEQIRDIVFLRTQRADFFHNASVQFQPVVRKIASELSIDYDDLLFFSPEEVLRALVGEFNVHDHIATRKKLIVIYLADDSVVLEGPKAEVYVAKRPILNRAAAGAQEVKGRVAYTGKVTGSVKVVIADKEAGKVEKGDILISIMTTPNFIPAMERAAAFVTDEGGITCHAAIIAREMKKPCITATGTATQVFKDGDMVEVDAEKGIVKKIYV